MGAFRFPVRGAAGQPAGELYAYDMLPKGSTQAAQGVVLCNPFGQEAVRAHRLYRVLSERLARAGVACLRFDYFGSGESDGDDGVLTLESAVRDLQQADAQLRARAGCEHVSWFGLRFGATVAALASIVAGQTPDRLFLWDPVQSGAQWLKSQQQEHEAVLRGVFEDLPLANRVALDERSRRGQMQADGGFESQGFLVSQVLAEQMAQVKLATYLHLRCSRLVVLAAGVQQRDALNVLDGARNILSLDTHLVEVAQWNSDEAMNASIVPHNIVEIVTQEMAGGGR